MGLASCPTRRVPALGRLSLLIATGCVMAGCQLFFDPNAPPRYRSVAYSDLPGWADGRQAELIPALARSCARLLKKPAAGGAMAATHRACRAVLTAPEDIENAAARTLLESQFQAVQPVRRGRPVKGLFTGYFEPIIAAAPRRSARYRYPIYALPPSSGPFPARATIDRRVPMPGWQVLYWAEDPIALFFLHIQGSGLVRLPDGRTVRIGYAGTNRQPYRAIGRLLIDEGHLAREDVTLQSITAWLLAHPERMQEVFDYNPSYVFFRRLPPTGPGPIGAEGLPLTAGRSLAVDRRFVPYGTPVWVVTHAPGDPATPFRRLMVAQDTGGAIRGAVRGDVFFGSGPEARELAGKMKSPGSWFLLRPRPAPRP